MRTELRRLLAALAGGAARQRRLGPLLPVDLRLDRGRRLPGERHGRHRGVSLVFLSLWFNYFAFCEWRWGQTIAKNATGIEGARWTAPSGSPRPGQHPQPAAADRLFVIGELMIATRPQAAPRGPAAKTVVVRERLLGGRVSRPGTARPPRPRALPRRPPAWDPFRLRPTDPDGGFWRAPGGRACWLALLVTTVVEVGWWRPSTRPQRAGGAAGRPGDLRRLLLFVALGVASDEGASRPPGPCGCWPIRAPFGIGRSRTCWRTIVVCYVSPASSDSCTRRTSGGARGRPPRDRDASPPC